MANDNDFLPDLNRPGTNPNQFFVFGFTNADVARSMLALQQPLGSASKDCVKAGSEASTKYKRKRESAMPIRALIFADRA